MPPVIRKSEQPFTIHLGDCLDVLPKIPAQSVDAVVTDPPYGLSKSGGGQSDSDRVFNALRQIGFPNLYKRDLKSGKNGDFMGVVDKSSHLGGVDGSVRVVPRIGVPKGSVHFDRHSSNKKINASSVPTRLGVSNSELTLEDDFSSNEFLGDFILKLGDVNPIRFASDKSRGRLAESFFGGFSVPISTVLPSGFPGLESSFGPIECGNQDIGLTDNPRSDSDRSSGILTGSGAINTLMLRFDVTQGPVELFATHRADQGSSVSQQATSSLVRARTPTSSLPAVAKSHRIRFVLPGANGTCRHYWFHLWTPKNSQYSGIVPSGGFMGKDWDSTLPNPEIWRHLLRVLKPGGHLVAFAGTRTYHRMACAIEDAGFYISDQIAWVYGSGFPKSSNTSKGLDSYWGYDREKITIPSNTVRNQKASGGGKDGTKGSTRPFIERAMEVGYHEVAGDTPISEEAETWNGWGSALKPSMEPICVAQKPFSTSIARNILKYGTGAMNIDACRVGTDGGARRVVQDAYGPSGWRTAGKGSIVPVDKGRWPANFVHDGSEEAVDLFPTTGASKRSIQTSNPGSVDGAGKGLPSHIGQYGFDEPAGLSAARFFYCAKASAADRDEGLESLDIKNAGAMQGRADGSLDDGKIPQRRNIHPTVKPISLMRWLVRLVTPLGGVVLDPFAGSGSTGKACGLEGMKFIGIEQDPEYVRIATLRTQFGYKNRGKV